MLCLGNYVRRLDMKLTIFTQMSRNDVFCCFNIFSQHFSYDGRHL